MNWPEILDRKLLDLCLQGNTDAWVEFLRRFQRLVTGVTAKTIRPCFQPTAEVLENLWQDTLHKVLANDFRALRKLEWRHEGSLRGLLRVTASTVAQDYVRKWRAQRRDVSQEDQLDDLVHDIPDPKNPAAAVQSKILLGQLARCLEKQIHAESDHTRDIAMFLLFYGSRVTASDLARVYMLGTKTVENTVARLARIARKYCL